MNSILQQARLVAGCMFAVLCLLVLVPFSLQAQELRGKITGRVSDQNGAAVAGATVKVTDVGRNQTSDLTTNSEGLFEVPYLLPGTYKVDAELKALIDGVENGFRAGIIVLRLAPIDGVVKVRNCFSQVFAACHRRVLLVQGADGDLLHSSRRVRVSSSSSPRRTKRPSSNGSNSSSGAPSPGAQV